MAKEKREYEVVGEFRKMATQIVDKYSEQFYGIDIDKIQCVKVINKARAEKKHQLWENIGVKMPVRMDCPYAWYITIFSDDWDILDEKHKLLLVSEILCSIPTEGDGEGKINSFDSKGFKMMQRTFRGIDYLKDPDIPHILDDEIKWVQ